MMVFATEKNRIEKEPILTRNFFCTFMAQFSCALVMYTLMTTIGEYVTSFGATAMIAGMVSGMYVFGGLFSRLISGQLLEIYGWKRIALIFLILHFLASCCYFLADNVTLLVIVRFIHGLGFGAASNAIMVIGMASLPKSRYSEATGYFMLSTSLAIAFGPYVGGKIFDMFGGTGSFITASFLSFLCVLFMSFADTKNLEATKPIGKEKEKPKTPKGIYSFIEPKVIPIALSIFCLSFGYAALLSFYRLYAIELNMLKEFSIFFLIYAVVLLFSRPLAGKIQDRFGDHAVCIPSMIFQVTGLVLIAWKPSIVTIVLCAAFGALGYGTLNSSLNSIVNRSVTNERRPFAVSTYWAACDFGVGIGPMLLGAVVTWIGYREMYFVAAGLSLVALPIYLYASWKKKPEIKEA